MRAPCLRNAASSQPLYVHTECGNIEHVVQCSGVWSERCVGVGHVPAASRHLLRRKGNFPHPAARLPLFLSILALALLLGSFGSAIGVRPSVRPSVK